MNGGVADEIIRLKVRSHEETVLELRKLAKEKCMLAGSLVARQVSQTASLIDERSRLNTLKLKADSFEAALAFSALSAPQSEAASTASAAGLAGRRDGCTQTDDTTQALTAEINYLLKAKQDLVEATRNSFKTSLNMIELLKKRNTVLLTRHERALERCRSEKSGLQQRVLELQERLAVMRRP